MSRSGSRRSASALVQSSRWTDTPFPRVMKPMMASPGTGVQQRATLTHTSSVPTTTTPGSPLRTRLRARDGTVASARSSLVASSPPSVATSRDTTCWAETFESPTAAKRLSMSE